ncbi:hypothetical protein [Nakamurella sp.]|uniref:hypothetical protein n=1 Tax=Nakamurella sp. TaxID=1869182 RepID=UPI003B3B7D6B
MIVVVDVANVLGSRPDGWWRDRAGAAGRLLDRMAALPGSTVDGPDGAPARIDRIVAVLEGAARAARPAPADGLTAIRAEQDGDAAVVGFVGAVVSVRAGDLATELPTQMQIHPGIDAGTATGTTGPGARSRPGDVLVVTADRGLRHRLPPGVRTVGPTWLNGLIGR